MKTGKIFCFIETVNNFGYIVTALSEDGDVLASHASSSEGYAKHDIGIGSNWKHDRYKEKYPDGYELIWLTQKELEGDDFQKAFACNQGKAQAAKTVTP